MKIAVVCYESMGVHGGSALQVLRLAEGLAGMGHDVVVYAPGITRSAAAKVPVSYIPIVNVAGLRFISYLVSAIPHLLLNFLRSRPDAVLVFEIYFDLSALLASKFSGAPFYLFINGIAEEELNFRGLFLPLKWVLVFIRRLLIRAARRVYTISPEIAARLGLDSGSAERRAVIVRNGVDKELFSPAGRGKCAEAAGLDPAFKYVGFVGRAAPWHGLEYLVPAAKLLAVSDPSAKFLIVGDGPSLQGLRRRAEEEGVSGGFVFAGSVPHAAVPGYIGACEICVVLCKPVRSYPGDPMKMYEYMACGRPVIASDVPGYGDFLEEAGAGLAVDASSPEKLAGAISGLLADERLRSEMGARGRAEVAARHTWAARAKQIAASMEPSPRI